MRDVAKLAVEHYTADRVDNPNPRGETPWHVYHTVRNAMVRCCRKHGPVGPLGVLPFDAKRPQFEVEAWERGDEQPVYWIVDDQYNDEMYLYMELEDASGCTSDWLADVTQTLAQFPGWGIGVVSLKRGYVLIFADRLMVQGPGFQGCRDVSSVLKAMREQV
jgi:hypothetical protein